MPSIWKVTFTGCDSFVPRGGAVPFIYNVLKQTADDGTGGKVNRLALYARDRHSFGFGVSSSDSLFAFLELTDCSGAQSQSNLNRESLLRRISEILSRSTRQRHDIQAQLFELANKDVDYDKLFCLSAEAMPGYKCIHLFRRSAKSTPSAGRVVKSSESGSRPAFIAKKVPDSEDPDSCKTRVKVVSTTTSTLVSKSSSRKFKLKKLVAFAIKEFFQEEEDLL